MAYLFKIISIDKTPYGSAETVIGCYFSISELFIVFLHMIFEALFVKARVECVEVLAVELVGEDSEILAESLIVHNLTLTQEANRVLYVVVITESQNVVVRRTRLLLRKRSVKSSWYIFSVFVIIIGEISIVKFYF